MASADNRTITIEYPDELLGEMGVDQLQRLAREAFYVRLYEQGKISSGRAGAMLGMSRSDFLDLLNSYGVSYFDEHTDLQSDLANAEAARRDRG